VIISYATNALSLIEYDTDTDKIIITNDPYGQYERSVQYDRAELSDILSSIEKDAAKHRPQRTNS
jgi:hypothetical protein